MDQENTFETNAGDDTRGPAEAQTAASAGSDAPSAPDARAIGRGRWIAAAAAAVGVALFAVPFLRGPEPTAPAAADRDVPADGQTCAASKGPANLEFTLQDVDGAEVRLSEFKGKVILLNFWATWCGPCKVEIPALVEAYNEYRNRGFVVLAVLSQDDPSAEDLRAFARDWDMSYPILREHSGLDDAFGPMWAIPTSFLIDRRGSICTKHLGPVSKEMLDRELERLL